jgi:hypothetical protein
MQVAIVKIIGVTLVLHRRMAAVGTVGMGVAVVKFLSCHEGVLATMNSAGAG